MSHEDGIRVLEREVADLEAKLALFPDKIVAAFAEHMASWILEEAKAAYVTSKREMTEEERADFKAQVDEVSREVSANIKTTVPTLTWPHSPHAPSYALCSLNGLLGEAFARNAVPLGRLLASQQLIDDNRWRRSEGEIRYYGSHAHPSNLSALTHDYSATCEVWRKQTNQLEKLKELARQDQRRAEW